MLRITTRPEEVEATKFWREKLHNVEGAFERFGEYEDDKLLALKALGIDPEEVVPPELIEGTQENLIRMWTEQEVTQKEINSIPVRFRDRVLSHPELLMAWRFLQGGWERAVCDCCGKEFYINKEYSDD